MINDKDIYQELDKLKNKILNVTLVVFSILAFFAISATVPRELKLGLSISFYIQVILFILFLTSAYFRKFLPTNTKSIIIFAIVFITVASGMFSYGVLASSKVYIIAIPVFFSFIFSFRKSLTFFLVYLSLFVIFGTLYSKGILTYNFNLQTYTSSSTTWIMESVDTTLVSIGLLIVGYYYRNALITNSKKIQSQNKELIKHRSHLKSLVAERTKSLEKTNKELLKANDELSYANIKIKVQHSELKDTLNKLQNTQLHLINSEKMASLGILTAGIAHEINNPLNFILGGYTAIKNHLNSNKINSENMLVSLNSIKEGIDRATNIITGLNQFSRNNEDYDEICDIHSILDNCIVMLNNKIKHRIIIVKNYTSNKACIKGNVGKLHQVFLNIINNSCQAIKDKGEITISTIKNNNTLELVISDTGSGISKENLTKITDPFFTTKDPGKGVGLGLSISQKTILEHSGTLSFESKDNYGTIVNIHLPY